MHTWLRALWQTALEQVELTLKTPWLWVTGILMPVLWSLILISLFNHGMMTGLPVGLVDLDNSYQSRQSVQAIEALPSVEFSRYDSALEAREDLAAGHIYALVVFPEHWSRLHERSDPASAVELYLNKTSYAIATTLEADIKTAFQSLQIERAVQSAAKTGGGFTGGERTVGVLTPAVALDGNIAFNFKPYLLATLIPGVLGLAFIVTVVGVLCRDWQRGSMHTWLTSDRPVRARFAGLLLPWFVLYSVMMLAYVAWFAGYAGWTPAGSILLWCLGGILFVSALVSTGAMIILLAPSWIIGLSAAICYCAPVFPFTGFSYPFDSMAPAVHWLGEIFPLTWFIKIQASQWILGASVTQTLPLMGALALFTAVPLTAALLLVPSKVRALADRETRGTPLAAKTQPFDGGVLLTAWTTVRRGLLSVDTFAIFAGAVPFYLVFYALPYAHQSVVQIDTAVVDLDRSSTSRDLVQRLRALPALHITAVDADLGQVRELYRTARVSNVIVVPEHFERDLLAGRPTRLSQTGSGAFPVKSRAVQAALMGVVLETSAHGAAANLMRRGASYDQVRALSRQPVAMVSQNMFNPISGYASYTVPLVAPIIIQAILLMAIVMSLGGWLARRERDPFLEHILGTPRGFFGLFFGFWLFGLLWFCYTQGFDFYMFDFASMVSPLAALVSMGLFVGCVIAFGLMMTLWLNSNVYGAQLLVLISAPAVFLSGGVYPLENFHWLARLASFFVPTTPGVQSVLATSQNGAGLASVSFELMHMLVMIGLYSAVAYALARRRSRERGVL